VIKKMTKPRWDKHNGKAKNKIEGVV